MADERVAGLVARLRRVPDSARAFEVAARDVQRQYGLGEADLEVLVEAGLPCATVNGERRYEHGDLHYVGLRLGTAKSYLTGIRLWTGLLRLVADRPETELTVKYVPSLGAASSERSAIVHMPDGRRLELAVRPNTSVSEARVRLHSAWPSVPPTLATEVEQLGRFEFYYLPSSLRLNWRFAATVGLIDCATAAHMIVDRCAAWGLNARVARGFLLSLPFSTIHAWAAVLLEEVWVPFDPILIDVMRRFGGLDPEGWPLSRPFAIVAELPAAWPIVTETGTPVDATFMTSLAA
jgi:Transglutaminase-like superfamily